MPDGQDSLLISTLMGKPDKLTAGVRIFDGYELMLHTYPSRNARRAGFADSAYPALEYDR